MIIVTGGAGFIGSNIINALNNIGYNDILVVDNLKNGKKFINLVDLNIIDYIDKEDFIDNILSDYDFGNIDVIFHEGACSSTTEWNGKYIMRNNYQYSKELLNYCLKYYIPFIYASSAAVYGTQNEKFEEKKQHKHPLTLYGYSKFLFDQYVFMILKQARSQICGLRYFNVYGPREEHKGNMASLAFHLNKKINNSEIPQLFLGSNGFKRDFIYVKDITEVNLWFWKNNISGIYDCGTGVAESFQSISDEVLKFHNIHSIKYIPFPENLKGYYQTYTKANMNELRSVGYNKSFKTITEGIRTYLNLLNHKP